MNNGGRESVKRSDVLELWWVKARRAASGQNNAAVRAATLDERYTLANIMLPLVVFAISFTSLFESHILGMRVTDLIAIPTALILGLSYLQYTKSYRVKAIEHRQAGNEFDAIAQQIEATEFQVDDDVAFHEIGNRLERVRRTSPHVPGKDWMPAKDKFDSDISTLRTRLRERLHLEEQGDSERIDN